MYEKQYYEFIPDDLVEVPVKEHTFDMIQAINMLVRDEVVLVAEEGQLPAIAVDMEAK